MTMNPKITVFKFFIWGCISSDIRSEILKHDFRPYIRQYTSPNENFEYGYPQSNVPNFYTSKTLYFV